MAPPPIVTGLSPNEGPPGTRIKIRGENFGSKPTDLTGLTICGFDCLLSAEWKSPNKIIAISGAAKGKGDIVVTTRLGGVGTCNVTFKGYYETIGPMKESAVWVEEAPLFVWGRHSLSPTSFQQEDPLGLSVEGNDKKFPEDDLINYFPEKSGDIASKNFAAGWFLLENHHATSFNDLQAGLIHLRRKVEGQKEGQLSFLKANIGSVMDQVDTLVNLRERYQSDLPKFGNEPTLKLEKAIKESEREGRKLFDDVLARRDRAEKTRNALNVLMRFRFLFCLPCVIDRNIKKGEYDIVINDYIRVKNLFNKTDIHMFKSALNEVDKRINELQNKLHADLQTMPITVDQQKRLIRYLVNLDCPYDPAWDAIKSRSDYINDKIKTVYNYHKSLDKIETSNKSKNNTPKYSKYNQLNDNTIPANINFIDEICLSISETFSDLWKIGQAYFSGELRVRVEPGRQVEFKHIVMTIMESSCKLIRSSIIPNTLDKSDRATLGAWTIPEHEEIAPFLPEILRCVRSTYTAFIKLDLPSEALDIVSSLLFDLRIHCMSTLFKQAAEQVKHLTEDWKIDLIGKHVGITELPIKFECTVQDVIQIVKESVLSTEQRQGMLLDNATAYRELEKQLETVLMSFHNVLNNLSSSEGFDDDDDASPIVSQLIGTPINGYKTSNYTNNNLPIWEHRLLITLSNCQHTKNVIIDSILRKFKESGFPPPENPIRNVKDKLDILEKTILEKYLEQKSDPLVGTIEPSMYLGRFDWDMDITPVSIKPYAKECINNVIHVHSEINSISSSLLDSVLPQVVLTIAEELYRLMSCVQKFSTAGAQQARADISALQIFFEHYSTSKAKSYFQEALDIIPALENSQATIVHDIIRQCKARMRIQLLCLSSQANGPVLNQNSKNTL